LKNGELSNVPPEDDLSQKAAQEDGVLDKAKKYLAEQIHEVFIPSYSAWFNMDTIHDIEKKALPEFFSGLNRSKTPTVYKESRDFMINTFRLNPNEYLTVTSCRRVLPTDVATVIRLHAFLEQWGLVNYKVDPETRPSTVVPPFTGHFQVTADTPKGLQPFQPFTTPNSASHPAHPANVDTRAQNTQPAANLELRRSIYKPVESPKASHNCSTCSVDCSKLRYHNLKDKTLNLCSSCYLEGRFPSNTSSGDFIRMEEPNVDIESNDWTDQETLLLLEGLEMYQEDWNKVAEHVGTRDAKQCILQFLKLPIEDPYLEPGTQSGASDPLQYQRLPFSQTDNPVMSVVAFLASAVNPGVAAAAAQSALKHLTASEEGKSSNPEDTIQQSTVEKAAAAALGAAAAKANVLAQYEDKEIQRLVHATVEAQLMKIELKLSQFEELERLMEKEKQDLDRQRTQLYHDYLKLKQTTAAPATNQEDAITNGVSHTINDQPSGNNMY
jgi:SWI/SNF related-matrix-associated actin-dependent regulator of chromatin subfamily C